jgi:hypothetical protein
MSVVFSGTTQGSFVSTGQAQILQIPEGVDYINVYNQTQIAANSLSTGYQFYWQYGMPPGTGIEYQSNAGGTAILPLWLTTGGFTPINNTINTPGANTAITLISNATPPQVTQTPALVAGSLNNGQVVRLFNVTGAQQLGGLDFTVGAVTPGGAGAGTFTLAFMSAIAAATTGSYRIIPYDPYFYPPTRVISKIRTVVVGGANATQVTMTVTHNFTIGQAIRFLIPTVTPTAFGMPGLNQVQANIIAINTADANGVTNTITVAFDSSSLGTFAWPLTTNGAFTPAQVVPVGENTAQANLSGVNPFEDAELNIGFIGLSLAAGQNSPAGQTNDVIYWVAGKSYNGQ